MIRHELVVVTPLAAAPARASVLLWCQTIGYRLVSPPFLSSVDLERGSWVGNFGSLNPKTWRSRIRATFRPLESGCEVLFEWTVTTAGQVGTKADVEFWTYEVERTAQAAFGVQPVLAEYTAHCRKTQVGNTWRALIFTAALLGPLLGISIVTGSGVVGVVSAAVLGTATWLIFRAPRVLKPVAVSPPPTPPMPPPPPPTLPPQVPPPVSE